jgi:hypothetical protein
MMIHLLSFFVFSIRKNVVAEKSVESGLWPESGWSSRRLDATTMRAFAENPLKTRVFAKSGVVGRRAGAVGMASCGVGIEAGTIG